MKIIGLCLCILFFSLAASAQTMASWKIGDVTNYFGKKTDSIYIINFWATFCKPCVAEIPYLERISKKYSHRKVALLLVSVDLPSFYPAKIINFASSNHFTANMVWLNESDADHFCPVIDSTWSGSIPATLFVNAATGYKKFIESSMSEAEFESELIKAIGNNN